MGNTCLYETMEIAGWHTNHVVAICENVVEVSDQYFNHLTYKLYENVMHWRRAGTWSHPWHLQCVVQRRPSFTHLHFPLQPFVQLHSIIARQVIPAGARSSNYSANHLWHASAHNLLGLEVLEIVQGLGPTHGRPDILHVEGAEVVHLVWVEGSQFLCLSV